MTDNTAEKLLSDGELKTSLDDRPSDFHVTADYIKSRIAKAEITVDPDSKLTECQILVDNGYAVLGECGCIDPETFDEAAASKSAYENAFDKLWPLFGFVLQENRYQESLRKAV